MRDGVEPTCCDEESDKEGGNFWSGAADGLGAGAAGMAASRAASGSETGFCWGDSDMECGRAALFVQSRKPGRGKGAQSGMKRKTQSEG